MIAHVKVSRVELLETLRKNREQHVKDYEVAKIKYRETAISQLETMLQDAKAGRKFDTVVLAPKPSKYTDSYDRAIRMLEMSKDDLIELTDHEFKMLVMDEWNWSRDFTSNTKLYSNS